MRSPLAFPLVLLVTLAVALLPARWMGWSHDVAAVVLLPLRPFTHVGNALAGWLRPPPPSAEAASVPDQARKLVEQLIADRDLAQRLYQAEHLRVLELEEQTRQLQQIPPDVLGVATRIVTAYVTMRSPASALGPVEIKLERGAPADVPAGTVAVYAGVHLLGRTIDRPSGGICRILPSTNRATEPLRAAAFPAEESGATLEDAVPIHLVATGSGSFEGEVERTLTLQEGDVVRLVDPAWPRTAQMMIIGTVAHIAVNDREPLRHTVVVEPAYQVREVAAVTLVIEETEAAGRRQEPGS